MTARFRLLAFAVCATAALAGCKSKGDIVVEEGIGITALRTVCPAVGVPDYTGDVTLFNGEQRTASAMALTAARGRARSRAARPVRVVVFMAVSLLCT